jgi:hypothetical protein
VNFQKLNIVSFSIAPSYHFGESQPYSERIHYLKSYSAGLPSPTSLSAEPPGGDKLRDGETKYKEGQGEVEAHNEDKKGG